MRERKSLQTTSYICISNFDVNARNCETNLNSEVSDRVQNVVKVVQ